MSGGALPQEYPQELHILRELDGFCDSVAIIEKGKIKVVRTGRCFEPDTPCTAAFACSPLRDWRQLASARNLERRVVGLSVRSN